MSFSPVSWALGDPLTSAKLAQMVENTKKHDHRPDGSQGVPKPRWASGRVSVTTVANSTVDVPISFPAGRFQTGAGAPEIHLVIAPCTTLAGLAVTPEWGVRDATTAAGGTGFVYRTTSTPINVDWFAVQRD